MDAETIHRRRWLTLAVLSLSLIIVVLDNTVLNVALPTLVRELDASASDLQWMVDAYVLVFAGLLLTMGSVGDRFGRKKALIVGLAIFGAAALLGATADSSGMIIASRALKGIGGALIMPATLSIITNIFTGVERGRAIAMWAAVAGLGIVVGPGLGGWLLVHFWWGSIFFINVFMALAALALGLVLIPESRDPEATPLDPIGAVLSIVSMISLVYAIIEAPTLGWTDPKVLVIFVISIILLCVFLWWEHRIEHPLLKVEFFKNPRFSAASLAVTLVFFAMFGTVFLLPQYMQFVLGYSPLEAGLRVIPLGTQIIAAPLSARFVERYGTKVVVTIGLGVVAIAMGWLAMTDVNSNYLHVAVTLTLLGIGMGTAMAPATDSIMGSLPLAKAGVGSAMNDTTRQIGGALGVAILGSILISTYGADMASVVAGLPADAAAMAMDSIGGAIAVGSGMGEAGLPMIAAARQAFVHGMSIAVWVAAGMALVGAVITWLFLPARPLDDEFKKRLYHEIPTP